MARWETKALQDVVKLQRGHDLPSSQRVEGPVPVISSGDVAGWHNVAKASGPGVILGRATNIGIPKWCEGPYWPLNTTLYVTDFMGNDPKFIFHVFQVLDLSGFDSGSVQPMLNRNYIAQVPVQIPPIDEQRRIAGVLGALDDLIEVNRGLVENLVALSSSLVADYASRATKAVRLSALAVSTKGGVWGEDVAGPGLVPAGAIRGIDLANLRKLQRANPPRRFVTLEQLESRTLHPGDLVIEASGTNCGRAWVPLEGQVPDATVFSNFCRRFELNLKEGVVGPRFIQHFLNAAYEAGQLQVFRTGTAMPNLDVRSLLDSVEVPIGSDIWTLESTLTWLDTATVPLNEEIAQLESIRDELLPLLMSGRIRVAEDVAA